MVSRRTILITLLVCLGVAAAGGVFAVLLPGRDVMFQVSMSALAGAFAAGITMLLSLFMGNRKYERAGMAGMLCTILIFVLVLAYIWFERAMSSRMEDKLAATIVISIMLAPFITLFVGLVSFERSRLAAIVGILACAACFLVFEIPLLIDHRLSGDDFARTWAVGSFGSLAALSLVMLRRMPWGLLQWLGFACGLLAITYCLLAIEVISGDDWNVLATLAGCASFVAALVNLTWLVPLRGWQAPIRWVTWLAAVAGSGALIALAVDPDSMTEDFLQRLFAASVIVMSCGILALLVFIPFNRRLTGDAREPLSVRIVCPVCETSQAVEEGSSKCPTCGLGIRLKLDEPACPQCHYLLYRLTSDHCPECGHRIRGAGPEETAPTPA